MSAEHVGWAFRQQGLSPTRKLVLLALADRCNKDTLRCDPSIRRLMDDTGLGRTAIFDAMKALEESGFIRRVERSRENGGRTSSEYQFPSITAVRGESARRTGGSPPDVPQEPELLEPEVEPTSFAAAPRDSTNGDRKPRARNEVWEALEYVFGTVTAPTACSKRGKVCRDLQSVGATRDQIVARASAWPAHFDSATLTPEALEKHWDTLARKPLRRQR